MAYHAGFDDGQRHRAQESWITGRCKVIEVLNLHHPSGLNNSRRFLPLNIKIRDRLNGEVEEKILFTNLRRLPASF